MLPASKMEKALSGSVSEQVRMGLFDNMDCETLPGSRLESFAELLHRYVSQSSSGYNADVSGSYKSDSASLRMSRFSIASTFQETAPIACSSMLSRASLEPPILPISSEFAMPKHPVRQKVTRSANAETATPSRPSTESKDGTAPLPSHPSLYPDSTDCSLAAYAAGGPVTAEMRNKDVQHLVEKEAYTEIKVVRKRGRKPKIPEMIKETETSSETPPKKGRRGRPPADGTPAKNKSGTAKKNQQPERTESSDNRPASANPEQSNVDPVGDKSSEEYVREMEEAWRDLRKRSYEISNCS